MVVHASLPLSTHAFAWCIIHVQFRPRTSPGAGRKKHKLANVLIHHNPSLLLPLCMHGIAGHTRVSQVEIKEEAHF